MPDEVKLKWFPYDHRTMGPPAGLYDFQVGWYFNLFWSSIRASGRPGYLTVTRGNLWTYAGAHRRSHWDANCDLVMAAFVLERDQGRFLLHHPIAAPVLEEQLKKIKQKKGGGISEVSTPFHRPVGDLSPPLQSGFAFDLIDPIQIQKQSTARARAPARASGGYTQADFDARDLRKLGAAKCRLSERLRAQVGSTPMTNGEYYAIVAEEAGLTIKDILRLEKLQREWPESESA
jgi:hypothetical protein